MLLFFSGILGFTEYWCQDQTKNFFSRINCCFKTFLVWDFYRRNQNSVRTRKRVRTSRWINTRSTFWMLRNIRILPWSKRTYYQSFVFRNCKKTTETLMKQNTAKNTAAKKLKIWCELMSRRNNVESTFWVLGTYKKTASKMKIDASMFNQNFFCRSKFFVGVPDEKIKRAISEILIFKIQTN